MGIAVEQGIERLIQEGLLNSSRGRSGKNHTFDCPFVTKHGGKKVQVSESFGIHTESGAWHCFSCKSGGKTIFSLYWALTGKRLEGTESGTRVGELSARLKSLISDAADRISSPGESFGHTHRFPFAGIPANACIPASEPTKHPGATYLQSRGISKEVVTRANLHFIWGRLPGTSSKVSGDRIIFPIQTHDGMGYSSRSTDPAEKALKYYRPIHNVRDLFYDPFGYLQKSHGPLALFVEEGEIDVLRSETLGIPSVGLMRSSMSRRQAELLARVVKRYIMLDGDKAGLEGAAKAKAQFPWLELQEIRLPAGLDPGSFPDGYQKILKDAVRKHEATSPNLKLGQLRGRLDALCL